MGKGEEEIKLKCMLLFRVRDAVRFAATYLNRGVVAL